MTLRVKMLLIITGVIILSMGADFAILNKVILPSFHVLEREEAVKDLERCLEAFAQETQDLSALCQDWAAWNDTYGFVMDRNEEYRSSNLGLSTFKNNDLDLVYILDDQGAVVWGEIREPGGGLLSAEDFPDPFPEDHPLRNHPDEESAVAGVYQTVHGPLLLAARPVLTSNYKGPIRGVFIMGRFMDDDWTRSLAARTRVDLTVMKAADDPGWNGSDEADIIIEEDRERLLVRKAVPDVSNRPALVFRADVPRAISARGGKAVKYAIMSTALAGLGILLTLFFLTRQFVINPVSRLTRHAVRIGQGREQNIPLNLSSRDEIGTLACEFDRMVEQLVAARRKLMEQSYYTGMSEMAAGVLHNVRNAMNPILVDIERMRRDYRDIPLENVETACRSLSEKELSDERRGDLLEFVTLAAENMARQARETKLRLEEVAGLLLQTERILSEQTEYIRTDRPLEVFSLKEMVFDALAVIPADLAAAVRIETPPDMDDWGVVKAHRAPLVQVMVNLITNAAESARKADRQTPFIQLALVRDDNLEMAHLAIMDNGVGIAPENLNRVFERGFSTKKTGMSGFGLHWSANIISALGGRLYAENRGAEAGAEMHLIIPRDFEA